MADDPRSSGQSGKSSQRSSSNRLGRPAPTAVTGESFDQVILPHLDAASRLARPLLRNEHDVEDVVQDANGRAWLLRIVRNACFGWRGHQFEAVLDPFDEEQHRNIWPASDPETLLLQIDDATLIGRALRAWPDRSHQLLVLRELEGLSCRELADVMRIPIGTVMSPLSRACQGLRGALDNQLKASCIPARTHLQEQEADAVLV